MDGASSLFSIGHQLTILSRIDFLNTLRAIDQHGAAGVSERTRTVLRVKPGSNPSACVPKPPLNPSEGLLEPRKDEWPREDKAFPGALRLRPANARLPGGSEKGEVPAEIHQKTPPEIKLRKTPGGLSFRPVVWIDEVSGIWRRTRTVWARFCLACSLRTGRVRSLTPAGPSLFNEPLAVHNDHI
ncbi:hypothetical protein KFU94_66960 [Chloroflexi bacterium TSY]|nr:hypothetical protein [Chloroflexi bacterium TSY]MBV7339479.1 hypothetical protein [Chloroflexi bacterium TSY]